MSNEEILANKIEKYLESERNEPLLLNTDELILCMLALRIQVIYKTSDCVSDDVCEWKNDGDNLITSCGDYFNLYDNCTGKFKYCPVCGKRIKIVGD